MKPLKYISDLNDALLTGLVAFQEVAGNQHRYSYLTQNVSLLELIQAQKPDNITLLDSSSGATDLLKNTVVIPEPQGFTGECFLLLNQPNSIDYSAYTDPDHHVVPGNLVLAEIGYNFVPSNPPLPAKFDTENGTWTIPALCLLHKEKGITQFALTDLDAFAEQKDA